MKKLVKIGNISSVSEGKNFYLINYEVDKTLRLKKHSINSAYLKSNLMNKTPFYLECNEKYLLSNEVIGGSIYFNEWEMEMKQHYYRNTLLLLLFVSFLCLKDFLFLIAEKYIYLERIIAIEIPSIFLTDILNFEEELRVLFISYSAIGLFVLLSGTALYFRRKNKVKKSIQNTENPTDIKTEK